MAFAQKNRSNKGFIGYIILLTVLVIGSLYYLYQNDYISIGGKAKDQQKQTEQILDSFRKSAKEIEKQIQK